MKPAPPAASSDLERARALSRALSAPRAAPVVPRPDAAAPPVARLKSRTPPAPEPPPRTLPALEAGARWPRIVAWAVEATGASRALAIDRKGLLVAAHHVDDDEAARIGGRLALAFDQAAEIRAVKSLRIDWDGEASCVLEVGDGEQAVLLAVLGHASPIQPAELAAAIARAGG